MKNLRNTLTARILGLAALAIGISAVGTSNANAGGKFHFCGSSNYHCSSHYCYSRPYFPPPVIILSSDYCTDYSDHYCSEYPYKCYDNFGMFYAKHEGMKRKHM
jgi:hypothetical protein